MRGDERKKGEGQARRLAVSPETVRMLELGHPWVIADAFTRRWPSGRAGDVVELTDGPGRLLATALLDPGERVVARVLEFGTMRLDQGWLGDKLRRASDLRTRHADLGETTAYRLVNAEGDGLPGLTIDSYGSHLLVQLYSTAWNPHLPVLAAVLEQAFAPAGIYAKVRPQETRSGGGELRGRLLAGKPLNGRQPVMENGLRYLVDLEGGLHTGLFLDQRVNRRDLQGRCRGKKILNLFAYTGAFSVAAAAGGAAEVTSVDVSGTYLEWAKDNFRLNRLDPDRHRFLTADCFRALEDLRRSRQQFDLVLMDPPSFSTTSRSRFTTRQGTAELVKAALPLLSSGGLLITSSNHQKSDLPDYLKELRRGARQAGCGLRVVHTAGQPADFPYPVTFPEGRYLKYLISIKD